MGMEKKSKNILLDGIIIIIALIVALNIHKNNVNEKNKLIQEKGSELNKNAVLGEIAGLEGKIGSYKSQVNRNAPDSSRIISVINKMAQESGIKVDSIRPQQKQSLDFYIEDKYALSFMAYDYHTLGKFIHRLETNPDFFFVVEEVSLREQAGQAAGPENKLQISAQVVLSAIFLN